MNIVAAGAVDREFNYIFGSNWGGELGGGTAPPCIPGGCAPRTPLTGASRPAILGAELVSELRFFE